MCPSLWKWKVKLGRRRFRESRLQPWLRLQRHKLSTMGTSCCGIGGVGIETPETIVEHGTEGGVSAGARRGPLVDSN